MDTATPGDDSPSLMRNPAADILDLHLGEQLEVTDNPPGIIRRMWSREEFLHETAGMGGPDVAMRPRLVDMTSTIMHCIIVPVIVKE